MISVTAAIQQIAACRTSWGTEQVLPEHAVGRVLSEPLVTPEGKPLLDAGTRINFQHMALLMSEGAGALKVHRPPRITVLNLGEEAANNYTLNTLLKQYTILPTVNERVPAQPAALENAIREGLETDLLVICGEEGVLKILQELEVEQVFHKVRAKPFKSFWLGYSPTKTRVMVLPSNTFGVQVGGKLFLESYIRACWQLPALKPWLLPFSENRSAVSVLDEFVPAAMVNKNGLKIRGLHFSRNAEVAAAAHADGFICHSTDAGSLEPGSLVPFYPWIDPFSPPVNGSH
ncbi:hypothetical protein [Chitinophaga alhagiae]|uniref:hypothetical protein n=1 Tax=Chitinophaga alhagiae TaxID=2203219 RepID=UPI000E5A5EFC|nr:hypothetical protein [Chitinophaga alhagiae]